MDMSCVGETIVVARVKLLFVGVMSTSLVEIRATFVNTCPAWAVSVMRTVSVIVPLALALTSARVTTTVLPVKTVVNPGAESVT